MAMSISDLPREVVALIMLLLPPEYLIEFKCLSKYWYSLISALIKDRAFVAKHLDKPKKNVSSTCLVICEDCNGNCCNKVDHSRYGLACCCDKFHLLTKDDRDDEEEHIQCGRQSFELPWRLHLPVVFQRVYHCDGLIFVSNDTQFMAICNPAIKESRFLPQPCIPYWWCSFIYLEVGFGYDSKADDYKVVRFGWVKSMIDCGKSLRAEVYSLASNSWREIMINVEVNYKPFYTREVYCRGVWYWIFYEPHDVILSFDMCDEVFRVIPLPDYIPLFSYDRSNNLLIVLNESVALILYPAMGKHSSLELWVMDDCFSGIKYGKACSSWTKRLILEPLVGILCPLLIWKNEEVVVLRIDKSLVSYNIRTRKLRNINTAGLETSLCAFSYVKSLVPIKRKEQVGL